MTEIIKKIDAASRQLDSAIHLWFSESDPIAIHTLACSAHEIIKDINKHRKGPPIFLDSEFLKNISAEKFHNQIERHLKSHYNFFKHADKDPENSIEFDPDLTEFFILFSCTGIRLLGEAPTIFQNAFLIYFTALFPEILSQEGHESLLQIMPIDILACSKKLNRQEFFIAFCANQGL